MSFDFQTKKTIKSEVFPGVSFTFKVMTEGVRTRLNFTLAEELAKLRVVRAKLDSLDVPRKDDGSINEDAKLSPAVQADVLNCVDEIDSIRRLRINPAYFRACYISVDGLTIDGRAPTDADDMLENGPEDLYQEIIQYIRAHMELTPAERANLELPITSVAGADGQTSNMTAAIAVPTVSTSLETVTDSSSKT